MEYSNQLELYKSLIPAFKVKERLIRASGVNDVTTNDIWRYLATYRWQHSTNLTISDIVNDIIIIDVELIKCEGGKL